MKIFGIILVVLGVAACLLAIAVGGNSSTEYEGLGGIAIAIGGIGIIGAGAIILRNSRSN
jgi:peptidoglycan/LPS O-acetylase OafA/YrhL